MAIIPRQQAIADEQAVLGPEYGLAFYFAQQEFWRVTANWDRYEALYSTKERVELLNKSGSAFWGYHQGDLFEIVLLGLCRLTDPPNNRRQQNLSIKKLYELEKRPKSRLKQAVDRAMNKTKFARHWRHKRIAHNDFDVSTESAGPLSRATRGKVTNAIIYIHDVFRWINHRHHGSDSFLTDLGSTDAFDMMSTLADGIKLKEIRRAARFSGDYSGEFEPDFDWIGATEESSIRYNKQTGMKLPKFLGNLKR